MNRLTTIFRRNTTKVVPNVEDMYEAENDDHSSENENDFDEEEMEKSLSIRKLVHLLSRNNIINKIINNLTYEGIKSGTRWLLDSATLRINLKLDDILILLTIFILFDEDIKLLSTGRKVDPYFSTANAVCFFFFCGELIANSWSKTTFVSLKPFKMQGFLFSFFWWTDVLSILSIIPDITWMANPIGLGSVNDQVVGNSNYTKASRVIRLVRLVRIVRLYRLSAERQARKSQQDDLVELLRIGAITVEEFEKQLELYTERQSRLGAQLSDSITRRVIIIMLIMLIVIPLLTYTPNNRAPNFILKTFDLINTHSYINDTAKSVYLSDCLHIISNVYNEEYISYLFLDNYQSDPIVDRYSTLNYIRQGAKLNENSHNQVYFSNGSFSSHYANTNIIIDNNYLLRKNAAYSIYLTILVGVILVIGSHIFTSDAHILVIEPIDRMMNLVEAVAKNPLRKYEFESKSNVYHNEQGEYETKLLESTISKITGLLRVGFGEAGANIISTNLTSSDSSTTINPLVPGVRIYAIFGFCDILQFEVINQRLHTDVLTFVNHIAEIVHSRVHSWNGQCNKNLGNAFVIVWRIGDEEAILSALNNANFANNNSVVRNNKIDKINGLMKSRRTSATLDDFGSNNDNPKKEKKGHNIDLKRVPGVDILADKALIAYLKIIAEINRSKEILKYRMEPRLTLNGSEEFKVRMGFGLHAGWAIEGAVGSEQKVDATYLSPHVNMAARLETSSRQYGVPLLMSQNFYELMTEDGKKYCRKLDVVTVKGSEVPIGIYTYDSLQDQDFLEDRKKRRSSVSSLNNIIQSAQINEIMDMEANAEANKIANGIRRLSANKVQLPNPDLITDKPVDKKIEMKSKGSELDNQIENKILNRPDFKDSPGNSAKDNSGSRVSPNRSNVQFTTPPPSSLINSSNTANSNTTKTFYTSNDDTCDAFLNDRDLQQLRSHITHDFLVDFNEGIALYIAGDWVNAKEFLERANDTFKRHNPYLVKGDGPSITILKYMTSFNLTPPKTWKGYRPLTSK